MTETTNTILAQLPARLKEARRQQGLSLESVAKLSGVSRSMVSQIERGESSPTIATLWNLTHALQVDFAGLLDIPQPPPLIQVLRNGEVPSIENLGQGCVIRILSAPEAVGHHEVYEVVLDTAGRLESPPHRRGAREMVTVIKGTIEVTSDGATQTLQQGDTARYRADVPHSIMAISGPTRIFLIVQDA